MNNTSATDLSLAETLRIMDIAVEVRRQREIAQQELQHDELRQQLRERLLNTAALTGEEISPALIDVALDHYYENLHAFREPVGTFRWWLAHLYIRRGPIGLAVLLVGITLVVAWLWLLT